MSANPVARLTPEQYLAADREAEFNSEYFDGQMYPMSAVSLRHSRLVSRIDVELHQALSERRCSAYIAPRVRSTRSTYMYPDIAVVCGQPRIADDKNDILLNPAVIVEVLSPSTEGHDRGLKFHRYGQIESLKEYVLVSQDMPRVEVFRRRDNGDWLFSEYFGLNAVCRLESLDCAIPLAGIFDGLEFTPDQLEEAAGG